MKICTFIGHGDCEERNIPKLRNTIEELILRKGVDVFYVGTHGNFDRFIYNVLCELEKQYQIKINVVLAYLNTENDVDYETAKTMFPDVLENTPARFAIVKRNNYMIDKADYVVCYVNNSFSNSYSFAKRAIKKNKKLINLGTYKFDEV
ncbi:MAG: hypothetical protein IJA41_05485 [Clostridia bacterium]|nr:hypothetical protein [Clostridia bacterium]